MMRVICSWCGALVRDGALPASHGICPPCQRVHFPAPAMNFEAEDAVAPPIPRGTRVTVTPTARAFRHRLPVANWLGEDTTGRPVATVTLADDAPNEQGLTEIAVRAEDGSPRTIYDFNIVAVAE